LGVYQGNDLRKPSGGLKGRHRKVKRKYELGRYPTETTLGVEDKRKPVRVRGGNVKLRLVRAAYANVYVPEERRSLKVKIVKVLDNPANRDYSRRGVITQGALIRTEVGIAKVTSRPGQDGVINAVLVERV